MYLSRLILNPRMRQVQIELQRPYEMHRTIMRAFPPLNAPQPKEPRVLWRLDVDRRTSRIVVYVQSHVEPDWSALAAAHPGYLLDAGEAGVEKNPDCRDDLDEKYRFHAGQMLSFRLRANPAKKAPAGRKNNPRVGIIAEDEQLRWLHRRAEEAGFRIVSTSVTREDGPKDMLKGIKHTENGEHRMSLLAVRYEGLLAVADPDAFRKTIFAGIGPGKAFGFGLLSFAPAS